MKDNGKLFPLSCSGQWFYCGKDEIYSWVKAHWHTHTYLETNTCTCTTSFFLLRLMSILPVRAKNRPDECVSRARQWCPSKDPPCPCSWLRNWLQQKSIQRQSAHRRQSMAAILVRERFSFSCFRTGAPRTNWTRRAFRITAYKTANGESFFFFFVCSVVHDRDRETSSKTPSITALSSTVHSHEKRAWICNARRRHTPGPVYHRWRSIPLLGSNARMLGVRDRKSCWVFLCILHILLLPSPFLA